MRPATLRALQLLFLISAELSAQAVHTLPLGARVRVATGRTGARTVGNLARVQTDTLLIAVEGATTLSVPLRSVTSLEVSRGRALGRGAAIGAGIGAAVGGGLGFLVKARLGETEASPEFWKIPLVGAALVGTVGALAGLAAAPERWTSVPLGPAGADGPRVVIRTWLVAVSVRF